VVILSENRIVLVMGCDCDPLGPGRGSSSRQGRANDWQLTAQVLKALAAKLRNLLPNGPMLKSTFFIRSDTYMHDLFGEYAYCARVSHDFLDEMRSEGHEIGWHPHLWRWSGKWVAEAKDREFIKECLVNGFNSLNDYFRLSSARTGWDFMSNEIMGTFESLGLQADMSALPGLRYQETEQGIGHDWLGAPTRFYFPSRNDYRSPAVGACFRVLEMPITVIESPRLVSWARPFIDWWYGAKRSTTRYEALNVAKHPIFSKHGLELAVGNGQVERPRYILSYFHPSDLANSALFSLKYLETNVRHLWIRCRKEKSELVAMTAEEAAEDFLKLHGNSLHTPGHSNHKWSV